MRNYLTRKELAWLIEDDGHYYHVKIDSSGKVSGVAVGESNRYHSATNTGGRKLLGYDVELLRALVDDGQVSAEYADTYRYK